MTEAWVSGAGSVLRGPSLLVLTAGLIAVVGYQFGDAEAVTLVGGVAGVIAMVSMIAVAMRYVGLASVGGLIAGIGGVGVLLKGMWPGWFSEYTFDSLAASGALEMGLWGLVATGCGYLGGMYAGKRLSGRRRVHGAILSEQGIRVLKVVGAALLLSRAALQLGWGIHVVGNSGTEIGLPLQGVLYHVTGNVLLFVGASLVVASGRGLRGFASANLWWGLLVGILCVGGFGVLGAVGGSRGALFFSGIVLGGSLYAASLKKAAVAVGLCLVTVGVLAYPAISATRPATGVGADAQPFELLAQRVGGIDSLVPLAGRGADLGLWEGTIRFNESVKTVVYGLPVWAGMGYATTIWGAGFLIHGVGGALVFGVLMGVVAGSCDAVFRIFDDPISRGAHLTLAVVLGALVLEGTVVSSTKAGVSVVAAYVLVSFLVGRAPLGGGSPREARGAGLAGSQRTTRRGVA